MNKRRVQTTIIRINAAAISACLIFVNETDPAERFRYLVGYAGGNIEIF